jgi:hypothetical protein
MLRTFALVGLALPLLACARSPASPPAVPAQSEVEPAPLAVAYRVLRAGDGDGVVLSGHTQVNSHRGTGIQTIAAHSSAAEELELNAYTRGDGTVLVEVKYKETTPEGGKLQWQPSVRLARGAPARAEVAGAGWSRAIELTAE